MSGRCRHPTAYASPLLLAVSPCSRSRSCALDRRCRRPPGGHASRRTTRCCPATLPTAPRSPTAPTQITWVFDNAVPLETMTVTLIDATGARSELAGSTHGPAGDTEVVTPLPALAAGAGLVALAPRRARRPSDHRPRRLHDRGARADHRRRDRHHVARRLRRPLRRPTTAADGGRRAHRSTTATARTRRRRSSAGSCATARIWRSWRSSGSCSPAPTSGPAPAPTRCCDASSAARLFATAILGVPAAARGRLRRQRQRLRGRRSVRSTPPPPPTPAWRS